MITGTNYILVKIDKEEQKKKMERIGSIVVSSEWTFMLYYLQHGEILGVGDFAKEQFPQMEVGDIALFIHTIEDGDDRLLETLPDGDEIRWIDGSNTSFNFEIYGVIKPNGDLVPAKEYVFLDTKFTPIRPKIQSSLLLLDPDLFDNDERMRETLQALEFEEMQLAKSFSGSKKPIDMATASEIKHMEEVTNAIISKRVERAQITKALTRKRMAVVQVLHINPVTAEEIGVSEEDKLILNSKVLYPLEIDGQRWLIVAKNLIDMRHVA